jgi:prolyl-tRNA editing enzyme YbaK/EbsC (Cys-tRNA(Pro) deacylase)
MEGSCIFGAGGGRGRSVNFTPAKLKTVCMRKVAISPARKVRAALLELVSRKLQ